jgi:Flp pilus assembly protein TadB
MSVVAAGLAVVAAALWWRPRVSWKAPGTSASPAVSWLRRGRTLWAALAATAGPVVVSGWAGWILGLALGTWVHVWATRAELAQVRRLREAVRRDLPGMVLLLAASLRAGADPGGAIRAVAHALPGPGTDLLRRAGRELELGRHPSAVWRGLASHPELAPLAQTLGRASESGISVADTVTALAAELAERSRAEAEDQARRVGVRAAVPLGICLLPAFLLLGIVPTVVSLAAAIRW